MGWAADHHRRGEEGLAKSVLVYRVSSPQRAATLASLGATHVSLVAG